MTEQTFSIVCVSRQEWHAGLPTNRQQIMIRAAQRGHRVLFVETGGHVGRHLWRLVAGPNRGSVARRLFAGESPVGAITVEKAVTLMPWGQKFPLANRINSRLTAARIRHAARGLDGPRILWLYDPTAFELVGRVGEDLTVYDVVDDYAEQVGADTRRRRFVADADEAAASRSQVVFATTNGLYERQLARNPETHLVRNGADFAHFSHTNGTAPEVRALAGPVVGFAGNLTAEKVDFDLLEVLSTARALMLAQAQQKGLRLTIHVAPGTPTYVHGSRHHLEEILLNLLGNAVKFTDSGYVTLDARPLDTGKGLFVRFAVSDTGIGIAHQAIGRIFESFTQADESIINRYGGTGLGLSICRQLITAMGGTIGVGPPSRSR